MKCPNCGREFEGNRCPNCGFSPPQGGNRIVAIILLVFLTLPSAAIGACSGYAVIASGRDTAGFWQLFAAIGAVALVVFAGSILLVRRLWRGSDR